MIQPISIRPFILYKRSEPTFIGRQEARPSYDSFTGLKDKQCLLSDISKKMQKQEDIAIGMCDIDNFKSVNELLGYKTGDKFIKAISTDINTIAKKNSVDAYRFGGDEFVVLLFSGKDKDKNLQIMQEIADLAQNNPVFNANKERYVEAAQANLLRFEESNGKIRTLSKLKDRRAFIDEVFENAAPTVRQDAYMQKNR